MKARLSLLPAVLVAALFAHLKRTGGLFWQPTWLDVFLLVSWLGIAPYYLARLARWQAALATPHSGVKEQVGRLRKHVNSYLRFVNSVPPLYEAILVSGGIDTTLGVAARFVFQLGLLWLGPFWLLGQGLWFGLRRLLTACHHRQHPQKY